MTDLPIKIKVILNDGTKWEKEFETLKEHDDFIAALKEVVSNEGRVTVLKDLNCD